VPIHPLQIYDALLPLGIWIVIVLADRRGGESTRPFLLPLMVGLYALARFGTEFLRPNRDGAALLLSQWIELGAVLGVALLLTVGRKPWRHIVQATEARPSSPRCSGSQLT
jgi:prolipoprotein diacylglyceryltransferase